MKDWNQEKHNQLMGYLPVLDFDVSKGINKFVFEEFCEFLTYEDLHEHSFLIAFELLLYRLIRRISLPLKMNYYFPFKALVSNEYFEKKVDFNNFISPVSKKKIISGKKYDFLDMQIELNETKHLSEIKELSVDNKEKLDRSYDFFKANTEVLLLFTQKNISTFRQIIKKEEGGLTYSERISLEKIKAKIESENVKHYFDL